MSNSLPKIICERETDLFACVPSSLGYVTNKPKKYMINWLQKQGLLLTVEKGVKAKSLVKYVLEQLSCKMKLFMVDPKEYESVKAPGVECLNCDSSQIMHCINGKAAIFNTSIK